MSSYLIQLGPVVYERKGGGAFTLPEARREVYGVGDARILREHDESLAVDNAGSDTQVVYVTPDGRRARVRCRPTWQGNREALAGMQPRDRAEAAELEAALAG